VNPVAVTGLGLVTPLGVSLEQTLLALGEGRSAARRPIMIDPTGFGGTLVAEIVDFDARPWFRTPKALKLTDRQTRLAVVAAAQAADAAGWHAAEDDDLGVVIGTSGADLRFEELAQALSEIEPDAAEDTVAFGRAVLDGLTPLWGLTVLPNMPSSHVAIQLGARGPNSTVMTGWTAGLQAVAAAADWIDAGEATRVLAGGADTSLNPFAFASLHQAGMLDDGARFLPGEGAAVLALEAPSAARARGARIVGWVAGTASSAGAAGDLGVTLARVVDAALTDADWAPGAVNLIHDAAGGLPGMSAEVGQIFERRFGDRASAIVQGAAPLGHALGAAGTIASALALADAHHAWTRALIVSCDPSGVVAAVAFERAAREPDVQ
jgi:3-oxoacyl-[acyl-carrier-protein] synthase II